MVTRRHFVGGLAAGVAAKSLFRNGTAKNYARIASLRSAPLFHGVMHRLGLAE